ncbi:hypothetical protein B738_19182 [Photorhabdus temperata subsp. temperata M1021]|nr:hypothetical protein B738_19182 [Photorhabdus temperata subsp. temperata M1021]
MLTANLAYLSCGAVFAIRVVTAAKTDMNILAFWGGSSFSGCFTIITGRCFRRAVGGVIKMDITFSIYTGFAGAGIQRCTLIFSIPLDMDINVICCGNSAGDGFGCGSMAALCAAFAFTVSRDIFTGGGIDTQISIAAGFTVAIFAVILCCFTGMAVGFQRDIALAGVILSA